MNESIHAPTVRVVGERGEQHGILEIRDALILARSQGLDLVEIAPKAEPPVCKIIDWGKFQYLQTKKKDGSKKTQKKTKLKGVRFRPSTGEGDLKFKAEQAKKFLSKNNKIKIQVILRGREKAFSDQAKNRLKEFIDKIDFPVKIEQDIRQQGNGFNVIIAPEKDT
ncbi:MAG: translation initiation factor IF-3 [Candidatus Moranbacteria bacterium]|nr:translation initiation factor IF-3 [Candidatus Moranbacteria bacterium]